MEEQLVLFELAQETYGLNVAHVQSIIPMQEVMVVPGAPLFIEGVLNLRGMVVPIVDLRTRFKLDSNTTAAKKVVIVIVELKQLQVGLIVDKVTEVTRIDDATIEAPSPLLTSIDTAYLRGIGKLKKKGQDEESMIILLNLNRIFSMDEQQTLTETV